MSTEHSHVHMLSFLNQLPTGITLVDETGHVTFANEAGRHAVGGGPNGAGQIVGKHWEVLSSLGPRDKARVKAMCRRPASQRTRIPLRTETADGRRYWMEIDIMDDPRDPKQKALFIYNVSEVYDFRGVPREGVKFQDFIGQSEPMQAVFRRINTFAPLDATVLIEGETGTGKELTARAVHRLGGRRNKPFIAVNCAGLTNSLVASQLFGHKRGAFTGAIADHHGLIEQADGGTLFLDEIGDMSLDVQKSLLRVLQDREVTRLGDVKSRKVDVRVVAATHRNLRDEVQAGRFRQDLLYRIQVARVSLPPLREHCADIPLLLGTFLADCRNTIGKPVADVSEEAMRLLLEHQWPGNVRELKNAAEVAVINCAGRVLQAGDLPPEIADGEARMSTGVTRSGTERERILGALESAGGNRSKAARLLRFSRATLYRRFVELGIAAESTREGVDTRHGRVEQADPNVSHL